MTYQDVWIEQIHWLQSGLDYLTLQMESAKNKAEKERILAKMEGIRVALDRMKVTERIYNMHSSTNA